MQYTFYSLLRKHVEVMSEKHSKNHFLVTNKTETATCFSHLCGLPGTSLGVDPQYAIINRHALEMICKRFDKRLDGHPMVTVEPELKSPQDRSRHTELEGRPN